ncbi:ATP-binding protein [Allosalinactinospora lopnorensis]|uniref:ATP-binding protein n=1 Tax=Allosalinactinospora lopnorensis TaxID=1352348 RepID=UPI000698B37A|nr:ATP-binding protein [Allosalinactinospora lopnorensis]
MDHSITLPAMVSMVPAARRGVVGLLADFARVDDAETVATELVTNAMRHSSGEIVVRVHDSDAMHIEVRDQRGRHPRTDTLPVEDYAPDGLAIVSALAQRFGATRTRSGDCTTWAVLNAFPESPPDLSSGPTLLGGTPCVC